MAIWIAMRERNAATGAKHRPGVTVSTALLQPPVVVLGDRPAKDCVSWDGTKLRNREVTDGLKPRFGAPRAEVFSCLKQIPLQRNSFEGESGLCGRMSGRNSGSSTSIAQPRKVRGRQPGLPFGEKLTDSPVRARERAMTR